MLIKIITIFTLMCSWNVFADGDKFGSAMTFSSGAPEAINSSLIALLGNPKKWQGKAVTVIGYISRDFHGVLLFPSSELCKANIDDYSVLIDLDSITPKISWSDLPERNCVLARIEGKFFEIPREKPDPKTILIIRDRPAYIEAKYVWYL